MILLKKINKFLLQRQIVFYLLLFAVVFVIFAVLQSAPSFLDPDSFYHAKMVGLISQGEVVTDFSWLPFTSLADHYIDQHLLYHFLAVPFVWLVGSLVGLKLAATVFAALFFVIFFWFLQRVNQHVHPLVNLAFTFLLLFLKPLIFRLNLAKAPSLSLIFLLIGWYLIIQRRYWYLFLFSFVYVYLYGGWPLILVILLFHFIISLVADWRKNQRRHYSRQERKKIFLHYFRLIGSCSSGLAVGLILNPYFPQNLRFYWQQLVEIGMVNYQSVIRVGSEWYPYGLLRLITDTSVLSMMLVVVMVVFIVSYKKQSRLAYSSLLLTIFFFCITLKSQRYVEYYIPIAVLFSVLTLGQYLTNKHLKIYWQYIAKLYQRRVVLVTLLGVFWLISLTILISYDGIRVWRYYQYAGRPFNQFEQSINWLQHNVPAGQNIFHSDWDEFPQLFYHNDSNNYISGLDPTFLYLKNPKLYQKYVDITLGKLRDNLDNEILNNFASEFIFVDIDGHQQMINNLDQASNIYLIYSDKEAKIYRIFK